MEIIVLIITQDNLQCIPCINSSYCPDYKYYVYVRELMQTVKDKHKSLDILVYRTDVAAVAASV